MQDIEELESLPKFEKSSLNNKKDRYWGDVFPRNKFVRFLDSNLGEHINDVYSKYLKLNWVPKIYKNKEQFYSYIIYITFWENDEVKYFDFQGIPRNIKYLSGFYYLDPKTEVLLKVGRNVFKKKEKP